MRLRRASHVAWRRIGDETVLIHLPRKRIYVLNPSGGFFWHGLDGARDGVELASALEFPVDDEVRTSLEQFLVRLQEADLVETEDDGSTTASADAGSETAYPFDHFVPPELVWQEELRNFGASCAFVSGASAACDTVPTT